MSVREIVTIGDPVLRERAGEVSPDELGSAEIQTLIDDLIETKRAADGAGMAAPQVGVPLRIAVAEVVQPNRRYPYKPELPLTVMVNPVLEALDGAEIAINEGCLSIPNLRGSLNRYASVRVRYLDRDGTACDELRHGLTAGTFQHEVDHLDGVLFCDRAEPRTFATWDQYERRHREAFEEHARDIVERFGQ